MTEKDSKEKPEFTVNLDFPMVSWYKALYSNNLMKLDFEKW